MTIKSLILKIKKRFFGRYRFIGMARDLHTDDFQEVSKLKYNLVLATRDDFEKIMEKSKTESKMSAEELKQRKQFFDSGFNRCYIAKTADNDICSMAWLILPTDKNVNGRNFVKHFPRLGPTDALLEMAYTFEKYRGNRLDPSIMLRLSSVAKNHGAKRIMAYVLADNTPSIRSCERAGFKEFETRYQNMASIFKQILTGVVNRHN
jgi:L-amino acid N-acyltransferase YncA